MLPPLDQAYLGALSPAHAVSIEGGMTCVVIPSFSLPAGFTSASADLLLRLPAGYPDLQPDMWWFCPLVQRINGQPIEATQLMENYLGRTWQRWSRHLNAGQWRPGLDSIESYLALVRRELRRASGLLAA
jgi:hypothetical protein